MLAVCEYRFTCIYSNLLSSTFPTHLDAKIGLTRSRPVAHYNNFIESLRAFFVLLELAICLMLTFHSKGGT